MNPRAGTITITRSGGAAAHWTGVIERCEGGEGQVLKAEGGASVIALPGERGAKGLVIKRWELRTLGARVKSAMHASRAWRHWKGADLLTKAGLRTAVCYAIARSVSKEGVAVEWLVMDRLPGKTLLQHMADRDLTVEQEHALADALGSKLRILAGHNLHNRDGKPSNWIVCDTRVIEAAVIDTVGMRQKTGGDVRAMLASLIIEPIGCGVPPRRSLRWRLLRGLVADKRLSPNSTAPPAAERASIKALWRSVATAVTAHGDPTPKVNPLA